MMNIIVVRKFEHCKNYQNVTQRHRMSKCYGKMEAADLVRAGLPQSVKKNTIFMKCQKSKSNDNKISISILSKNE